MDKSFLLLHPWWYHSKIESVKSLHQGQVNGKKYDYGVQLWNATISIEYEITNTGCHYAYGMWGNRHFVDPTPWFSPLLSSCAFASDVKYSRELDEEYIFWLLFHLWMITTYRDAEAVDVSAASSASALPLPQKRSYFISSYPTHKCGSGWPN